MIAVEFQAEVQGATIAIPEPYRDRIQGSVRVIVVTRDPGHAPNKIDELLAQPLRVPDFQPLMRDEAHKVERA